MDSYVMLRNLLREDGSIVRKGQPVPSDISEDDLALMLEKGTIRQKRVQKPAPKSEVKTGE